MSCDVLIDEKCIFCKIVHHINDNSPILYEDSNFAIFEDIRPATKHHYLLVTKKHIQSGKQLKSCDIDMIKEMRRIGLEFIASETADESEVRLGFHWPPFNSISHLHMHVIHPISEMSLLSKIIFKTGTFWFVEVDDLIKWLQTK